MKRTLLAFGLLSLLFACKKSNTDDDDNNGGGGTPTGPSLTAADVSRDMAPNKTNYYYIVSGNAGGVLTVPAAGTNQTWNFGTLPTTTRDTSVLLAAGSAGFPTATYSMTEKRDYGTGPGSQSITVTHYNEVSAAGWMQVGHALPAFILAYPGIGATLEYNAQNVLFTPTRVPLTPPFPVKLNDSVNFNTSVTENASANAAAFGLNNAPTAQKTTYSGKTKAIATGKITLPGFSAPMDAMVVRRDLTTTDNYFLNGAPASPLLLQQLGLTDGEQYSASYYDFYNYGGIGYLGTIVVQGNTVAWARFRRAN